MKCIEYLYWKMLATWYIIVWVYVGSPYDSVADGGCDLLSLLNIARECCTTEH